MSKILNFAELDLLTVKPTFTLKTCFIYLAVMFFMTFSTKNAGSAIGFLLMMGFLQTLSVFGQSEKFNLDAFYSTLSISRTVVVLGRYMFSLLFSFFSALIGVLISLILLSFSFLTGNVTSILITSGIIFALSLILQILLLPIYFKIGYTKARLFMFIPFLIMFGFFSLIQYFDTFFNFSTTVPALFVWLSNHIFFSVLLAILIIAFLTFISIQLSVRFYKKREF